MSLFTHITVFAHERALEYVDGMLTRVLEAGRYRTARRAAYQRIDVRERIVTTAPQEVLTSDGVLVRVTAAVRWKVGDARAFVETVHDASALVYLAIQVALRDALVDTEADAIVRTARGATRGLAQLEAARAETAALRSLANAAKLLDEHPALARLRLVRRCPTAPSWSCRSAPTRRRSNTVAGHVRHYGGGHALRLLRRGVRPDRHAVAVPALPCKGELL